jgi:hypothetical protein
VEHEISLVSRPATTKKAGERGLHHANQTMKEQKMACIDRVSIVWVDFDAEVIGIGVEFGGYGIVLELGVENLGFGCVLPTH